MLSYIMFHIVFLQGNQYVRGEILRLAKWKFQELKWKISFLKHFFKKNFKLLFLLLKNVMWVFPCWCYKFLWINLFSFGDVNSVLINSSSKKFMRIIIFLLGTLFLNSCLHGFQKLNGYNHVFLSYLQVLELDLKFVAV
jgi:hypothetical protein